VVNWQRIKARAGSTLVMVAVVGQAAQGILDQQVQGILDQQGVEATLARQQAVVVAVLVHPRPLVIKPTPAQDILHCPLVLLHNGLRVQLMAMLDTIPLYE
jgi:hypothetical protein